MTLLLDQKDRQILDYGQSSSDGSTSYQLNKKHISLKKQARQYELRFDLIDSQIAICSKSIFTHLSADYTIKTLAGEFIEQLNTSEITEDQVQAYILPSNFYFAEIADPRTYGVIT